MGRFLDMIRNGDVVPKAPTARTKEAKNTKEEADELLASMRRLESVGVCIAILETGDMRVVRTEAETLKAIDDGYVIYSPQDMYYYVQLEPRERKMLHDSKKRFGGTVEWKEQ
jgi:hypothetical protein